MRKHTVNRDEGLNNQKIPQKEQNCGLLFFLLFYIDIMLGSSHTFITCINRNGDRV